MKVADDGLPVVGDQSKELGVRVPPNPQADVDVDANTNLVVLNQNGMSVAANWRHLPGHLIPARLSSIEPKARGSDDLQCYRLGDGPFRDCPISPKILLFSAVLRGETGLMGQSLSPGPLANGLELVLKPGSSELGNVVPIAAVTVSQFQADLAATLAQWVVDES